MVSSEELIRMIRRPEEEIPQRARFNGVYFGLVEDNKDPLKLGRLKLRTPVHFDVANMPTGSLPWAHYAGPYGGYGTIGFYAVPPIGSQVAVAFVDGDPSYQVWLGAVWGAPSGVSETHVASIDETNPYGVEPVASGHSWDYVKYNSLTTASGHRFELDDNISLIRDSAGTIRGQDFRRIGIEIPGEVDLTYENLSGTFAKGKRVVGQDSGASGLIIDDASSKLTLLLVQGKFRLAESVVDEDGASATISDIEVRDGFFLRMREDKLQTEQTVSSGAAFRGVLEIGTKDRRILRLDDEDQTIRIDTPESSGGPNGGGHFLEINSSQDFIRVESEFGHFLMMDDRDRLVELTTPGTDEAERGYRLLLDEANKRMLIKGEDQMYFIEMNEGAGFIRIASRYPNAANAAIGIVDFYTASGQNDNVQIYANDGQGAGTNGIMWDRGLSAANRAQQVFMYNDSRTSPSSWVRIVSAQMGSSDPVGLVEAGERVAANKLRIEPTVGAFLLGSPDAVVQATRRVILAAPNFNADVVEIRGPWTSRYFRHQHEVNLFNNNNAGKWFVNGTAGPTQLFVQQLPQGGNLISEPPRTGT